MIVQQILSTVKTLIVVNKSTENDRPDSFFFTTISANKENEFLARAEKAIAWHIEAISVVWTLLYNNPNYSRILIGSCLCLLEDRRTFEIIFSKFFPLCFKIMVERFENLDNILGDWVKEKIPKKSCRCIEQVLEAGRRKQLFLL